MNCRAEYPQIGAITETHGVDVDPLKTDLLASDRTARLCPAML